MNNLEATRLVVLVTIAIVVVMADIIVRLVILPRRKEKFIRELLDHLVEYNAEPQPAGPLEAASSPAGDLHECLLRYFEKSATSRQILNTLAGCERLTQRELGSALNRTLAEEGKAALPPAVARRVVMILLHAGLVEVDRSVLQISKLGQNLNLLLQTRKQAGMARSASMSTR